MLMTSDPSVFIPRLLALVDALNDRYDADGRDLARHQLQTLAEQHGLTVADEGVAASLMRITDDAGNSIGMITLDADHNRGTLAVIRRDETGYVLFTRQDT